MSHTNAAARVINLLFRQMQMGEIQLDVDLVRIRSDEIFANAVRRIHAWKSGRGQSTSSARTLLFGEHPVAFDRNRIVVRTFKRKAINVDSCIDADSRK